jgi:hypothetical protein
MDVFVLGDLVALAAVLAVDRLARLVVDQLLAQPVAGLGIDLAESDALAGRGGGRQRDGTGDERELEVALPIARGTFSHCTTQTTTGVRW